MHYNLETKISEEVEQNTPGYLLDLESLRREVPVAVTGETKEESNVAIVMITDIQFAKERVRVAKKHLQDYENLPDKGQFPFVEFKKADKRVLFSGRYFVADVRKALDSGTLSEL